MKLTDLVDKGIPSTIVQHWRTRHEKNNPLDADTLTHIQAKVFTSPEFWDAQQNLIVQGQTSSGKTLIGELAAAHCIANADKSVIYLVPFRAMVGEKFREFDASMGRDSVGWQIYASSSDYQEHDSLISRGRYNLAVIVYEKLFALMAAPRNRVLQNCGLIVVDECQMVGDLQRGPKLELILGRIMAERRLSPRIVCLTSISTNVEKVSTWLQAKTISDPSRPKQLRESVCTLQGQSRVRIEQPDGTLSNEDKDLVVLSPLPKDVEELMIALTRHHVAAGHKVLVFRSSKRMTVNTAEALAKKLPLVRLSEPTAAMLDTFEDDEIVQQFRAKLLPHGVAYHNASLSWELRDLIEDEFKASDGAIKVVIATETLAMGVNLPADIVIVADLRKPVGGDDVADVSAQEYKNYVGRAGRFGIGAVPFGRSYLLAATAGQADTYWHKFIEAGPTDIASVFGDLTPAQQAPYLLNWLSATRSNDKQLLARYLGNTLGHNNGGEEELSTRIDRQVALLEKAKLVTIRGDTVIATSTAEALGGYALSLNTIAKLKEIREFLAGSSPDKFPMADVLFAICKCDEIEVFHNPAITNQDWMADKSLRTAMRSDLLYVVPGSELDGLRKQDFLPNHDDLRAMKRVLLLSDWRTGTSLRDIRRKTKLVGFTAGDLSRLADVAAHLIEALAALAQVFDNTQSYTGTLRQLAGTVQYGVPEAAVPLANKHVRGLTRPMLKDLCETLPGTDLVAYILLERERLQEIPPVPRKRLVEALTRRLRQGQEIGQGEHSTLVARWIRQNVLDEVWKSVISDVYSADSAEVLASAFAEMLSLPPIGFVTEHHGSSRVRLELSSEISMGFIMGGKDTLLGWSELSSMVEPDKGVVCRVVVGLPDLDESARWRAQEKGILLMTPEALVQATLRSIAETRSGVPLSRLLIGHKGYASIITADDLISRYIPKEGSGEIMETVNSVDSRNDVFLSHAGADKPFVRTLAEALGLAGISYWFDENEIGWGDSITEKINDGLRNSRFVILCIGETFGERPWANGEMQAAVNRQNESGVKVVLPLLLGKRSAVLEKYPLLQDLRSLSAEEGLPSIVDSFKRVLAQNTAAAKVSA